MNYGLSAWRGNRKEEREGRREGQWTEQQSLSISTMHMHVCIRIYTDKEEANHHWTVMVLVVVLMMFVCWLTKSMTRAYIDIMNFTFESHRLLPLLLSINIYIYMHRQDEHEIRSMTSEVFLFFSCFRCWYVYILIAWPIINSCPCWFEQVSKQKINLIIEINVSRRRHHHSPFISSSNRLYSIKLSIFCFASIHFVVDRQLDYKWANHLSSIEV